MQQIENITNKCRVEIKTVNIWLVVNGMNKENSVERISVFIVCSSTYPDMQTLKMQKIKCHEKIKLTHDLIDHS